MNNIYFKNNGLNALRTSVLKAWTKDNVFILCDDVIKSLWADDIDDLILNISIEKNIIYLKDVGEQTKSINTAIILWNKFVSMGVKRTSLIINIGGGVTTDLGGFVASCFKRGISFINIPTTLLAQVDASYGGKTGINFCGLKNEIGTFSFPCSVIVDNIFLKTLSERDILSGYAEMIKHGLLDNLLHLQSLLSRKLTNCDSLEFLELIKHSINVKRRIVDADPLEGGIRRMLNLGHTVGHSIESYCMSKQESLYHGEAVAWGLCVELYLSVILFDFPDKIYWDVRNFIERYYTKPRICDFDKLIAIMAHDKKNKNNNIIFSLLKDIGNYVMDVEVDENNIKDALNNVFTVR